MPSQVKLIVGGVVAIILLAIILMINPFVIVDAGHRGVVLNWGAVSGTVLDEGIHFVTPIAQSVKKIEVRTVKIETTAAAYSKDLQTVEAQTALNYHVIASSVNTLFQEIGMDYEARIVTPAIQEAVKSVAAKFTAQELIEKRATVKDEIKLELTERLKKNYLQLDEFSITNLDFSPAYEQAIEAKQVSQQQSLKAENDLTRIKVEAEQRITQARAEAEAIKIQAQSISAQGGAEYVQMKAIEKWDGHLPTQMIPGATVPFINLNK